MTGIILSHNAWKTLTVYLSSYFNWLQIASIPFPTWAKASVASSSVRSFILYFYRPYNLPLKKQAFSLHFEDQTSYCLFQIHFIVYSETVCFTDHNNAQAIMCCMLYMHDSKQIHWNEMNGYRPMLNEQLQFLLRQTKDTSHQFLPQQ